MFRKEGALIMSITANGVIYFKSSIEEKYLNDFSFSIMEETFLWSAICSANTTNATGT